MLLRKVLQEAYLWLKDQLNILSNPQFLYSLHLRKYLCQS
jgi:hypothetical protein